MRAPRLRASPRHGGAVRCLQICLLTLIRRGGAPSGAAGFITNNYEELTIHYSHLFNLISWEILTLFFQRSFRATALYCFRPWLSKVCYGCRSYLPIFHGLGANHFRSCPFQQIPMFLKIREGRSLLSFSHRFAERGLLRGRVRSALGDGEIQVSRLCRMLICRSR